MIYKIEQFPFLQQELPDFVLESEYSPEDMSGILSALHFLYEAFTDTYDECVPVNRFIFLYILEKYFAISDVSALYPLSEPVVSDNNSCDFINEVHSVSGQLSYIQIFHEGAYDFWSFARLFCMRKHLPHGTTGDSLKEELKEQLSAL